MSSNSIYINPTTPYFYIIRDKRNSIKYAGAKWMTGCHPDTFMIDYTTSSNTINKIIEEFGIDNFEIIHITTDFWIYKNAYEYETAFLQSHQCSKSKEWYNQHNNTNPTYGSDEFKQIMILKYGVEHNSYNQETKDKRTETWNKNHDGKHPMQTEIVKEKSRKTNLDRYGVEYAFQSEEIKEKIAQTNLKNLGVRNPSTSDLIKNKKIETCLKNNGVRHSMQSEEVKEKSRVTMNERYGVDNYSQTEESKLNFSIKSKEIRKNDPILTCNYCNIVGKGGFMIYNHFGNCESNPNKVYDFIPCNYCDVKTESKSIITQNHNDYCKNNPNKKYKNYSCLHCDKISESAANMNRYHNNNCKFLSILL